MRARVRSSRIANFNALVVEVQADKHWQILDIFCLETWISRREARQEMIELLDDLAQQGYMISGYCDEMQDNPKIANL